VHGSVVVDSLAATRTVFLAGLRIDGQTGANARALILQSDAGAVRLQGLDLRGADGADCVSGEAGAAALDVASCANVVAWRCTLRGGDGADDGFFGGSGGRALQSVQSDVALYDTQSFGGRGGDLRGSCGYSLGYGDGGAGAPAVSISGGSAFCANVRLQGGDGGAVFLPNSVAGCGAPGLHAQGNAVVRTLAVQYAPGASGSGGSIVLCPPVAPDSDTTFATLIALRGSARRATMPRVGREQQVSRLELYGEPGDTIDLIVSVRPRFVVSDVLRGVSHLEPDRVIPLGAAGPGGHSTIAWPVAELGAGVQEKRLLLQAVFTDALGVTTLGTPVTIELLDSAF
jgi:hypothetical protein